MGAKKVISKTPSILAAVLVLFCFGYLLYLPVFNPQILSSTILITLISIAALMVVILLGSDKIPAFVRDISRSYFGNNADSERFDFDDAYNMLIKIASEESEELAHQFRSIKHEGDGDDQITALSETLRAGMEAESSITVKEALDPMQTELDRRKYLKNANNTEMNIMNIDDGRLIVKRAVPEKPPAVGVPFDVYGDIPIPVDGGYETERGVVAEAKYTEQLGNNQYAMEIQDWRRNIGEEGESVKGKLLNVNPTVQVQNRYDDPMNSDGLEDAVEFLQGVVSGQRS